MRRKDKQITDPNLIEEILLNNSICRLALIDGDRPYVIPINYGYDNGFFYLHSAQEGKKIDLMKINNKVCLEVTDSVKLLTAEKACGYSEQYRSVICNGIATSLIDAKEKVDGLKVIMKNSTGKSEWDIPESAVKNVSVYKIQILDRTGKSSGM